MESRDGVEGYWADVVAEEEDEEVEDDGDCEVEDDGGDEETHVAPQDWVWLQRNQTTMGCSNRRYNKKGDVYGLDCTYKMENLGKMKMEK